MSGESKREEILASFDQKEEVGAMDFQELLDSTDPDDRMKFLFHHLEFTKKLWLGELDVAMEHAAVADINIAHVKIMPFFWYHKLMYVSPLAEYSAGKGVKDRQQYLKAIKVEEKRFKGLKRVNSETFDSFYHYVKGERLWLQKKYDLARKNLVAAIKKIGAQNLPNIEARFNYRMRCFYLEHGEKTEALAYGKSLRNSLTLWGANRLVENLFKDEESDAHQQPKHLTSTTIDLSRSTSVGASFSTESFDLDRLQKASEAIMGQIDLEKTLDVIIRNIIELSGSTAATIFIKKNSEIKVVADSYLNAENEIQVREADLSGKNTRKLPRALISSVFQTRKKILCNDVVESMVFRQDD